ncbi:MAG: SigE family RNA polymerase sigma factor [Actinomycetota bacterium]
MRAEDEAEFRDYARARIVPLRRTAYLLCGDWHLADDLVQTTLTKLYVAWRRVNRREAVDGYTRQILVRSYLSERRRPWRREHPTAVLPERAELGREGPGERERLMSALARVPPRQRAVLVLRYWDDNSVATTAELLGCSEGTVKSQAARGLAALRGVLEIDNFELDSPSPATAPRRELR